MSFLVEKEICPACNGEKTIECCSCGAEEECTVMSCPYCQGRGVLLHYNMPVVIGMMGVAFVAVMAMFLLV